MNIIKSLALISVIVLGAGCTESSNKEVVEDSTKTITEKVDAAVKQLEEQISSFTLIATLDHHRMAAEAGVYTPPSIATIFSDSKVNTPIIETNQLAGLDLPYKILCYAEPDTLSASVAFTSAEFIQKRHNLDANLLLDYKSSLSKVIASFPQTMIANTDIATVKEGFGIVNIKSDFDFATTVQSLRDIIMSQGDTKWFADLDYQMEASSIDVSIRPTILLLFGGPAPGGKAMMTSPKIGLDAFCQKLLVYEKDNGEIWIAYNDIVDFAELYYQKSTKPQQVINQRLKMTFSKAVTSETNQ